MYSTDLLQGKSIIVTGGGSGLGLAMARAAVQHGAQVMICGRNEERLLKAVVEINRASNRSNAALAHRADVRQVDQVQALVNATVDAFGKVDGLINNAAGNFLCCSEDLTPNGFDAVTRIVLYGAVYCTLAVGRHLMERKAPGSIISILTTYIWTGSAYVLPSACAKAGVLAMTRSLAVEWGSLGIRLNAIAPGGIPTEGAWSRLMAGEEVEADARRRVPLGRWGTKEEIANSALFLLSDLSSYQTGDVITMDGGSWLAAGGQFSHYRFLPKDKLKEKMEAMKSKSRE
ncbi:MAG TPA: SDR family oxidoreductase [Acidobacteriota bacterium]